MMGRTTYVGFSIALLCATYLAAPCQSSNILFFQPYGSMSHTVSVMPALEGLAIRGKHNVTFLGMFAPKTDNKSVINVLPLQQAHDWFAAVNLNMTGLRGFNLTFLNYFMHVLSNDLCRQVLADQNFKRVVADRATTKYDVIIVDPLCSECAISLVWLLGSPPLIFYCTTSIYSPLALALDIPTPLSYVPVMFTPFSDRMTFVQRFANLLGQMYAMVCGGFFIFPALQSIVSETYPDVPSLGLIAHNASFVFSNSYSPAFDFPRPMAPFFAEVGGIHCRPAKPLPKNWEDFIQGAGEHGFIYFSLGTNIKGVQLPQAKIDAFIKAFGRLKQRVIWKFEDKIEGLPANVRAYKWLSQQDFLGHPKIKAFITQGGQLSTQEAVYHGVPVLGLPFIGEQMANIRNLVSKGMGEELDYDNLNEDLVYDALIKIANNTSYKESSSLLAKRMQDRPMDAIDTIVYWVDYVIRHNGAHHLRLNAAGLNFFQYFLLDVIAAILATLAIAIFVIVTVLRVLYRLLIIKLKSSSSSKGVNSADGISKKFQ